MASILKFATKEGKIFLPLLRKGLAISRRIVFSASGLLNSSLCGSKPARNPFTDEKLPLARVAVLGRGMSSKFFPILAEKKRFVAVILCNFEDRDLAYPELRDAIHQASYVILLSNSVEPTPSFKVAKNVGINCVMHVGDPEGSSRKRSVWRLNRLGFPVQNLPKSMSTQLFEKTMSTGIVGIAIGSLLSTNVEIFGIEFYRTDYIVGPLKQIAHETGESDKLPAASHLLQRSFENVASHQRTTHFTLHALAEHLLEAENITISRIPIPTDSYDRDREV